MMVNLHYWREHDGERRLLEFSKKERKVFFHDQDALNHVFRKQWFQLSPQWNRLYPAIYPTMHFSSIRDADDFNAPRIIHFGGYIKPWYSIRWLFGSKYRKLYYSYLSKTEWADLKPVRYPNESNRLIVYRHLLEYGFHRLFSYYLSSHYLYLTLRNIKHCLFR